MTAPTSPTTHIHPATENQGRYLWRRFVIRHLLLRPLGMGVLLNVDVSGKEHIPASGPTLIMINHIAAIDPAVAVAVSGPRYVVPMSKIENYSNPAVRLAANLWGVFPVRRGAVDRLALNSTLALLADDHPVLIAPEGTRQTALAEPKDGMVYIAIKANAAIVPLAMDGTDSFPGAYRRLRRPRVTVRIGRAFRFRVPGESGVDISGAAHRVPRDVMRQMTREAMYQLAALLPEHRRGLYYDLTQATTETLDFVT